MRTSLGRRLGRETTPAGLDKQQLPPRRDTIAHGGRVTFPHTGPVEHRLPAILQLGNQSSSDRGGRCARRSPRRLLARKPFRNRPRQSAREQAPSPTRRCDAPRGRRSASSARSQGTPEVPATTGLAPIARERSSRKPPVFPSIVKLATVPTNSASS